MLVGGIELEPEPNVNLLLILCGKEETTTDNDTFHLLCGICAANIVSDHTKVTRLPPLCLRLLYLLRYILRMLMGKA